MKREDLPQWADIRADLHLLLPILLLCVLLFMKMSPHLSAFWSIMAIFPVSWARRHTRITPGKLVGILQNAAGSMAIVALACASANIVITGLTITGLSVSLGAGIMTLSAGNLILAGVMLMLCTIVMGMGVPTSAAYAITASIGAPILAQFGVDLIPAHLFVLYFAVLADATPPVSVAAYVAASLAKAGPIQTGLNALKLAIAGFIVGFSYLFSSALTLDGTGLEIAIEAWRLLMALTVASACLAGYFVRPLGLFARLGFAVACLFLLFHPGIADTASALGLTVLVAALWFYGKLGNQGPHQSENGAESEP